MARNCQANVMLWTLIGEAMDSGTALILVPVQRLEEDFFQLRIQLAGQIIQKFVMYRLRLVILDDISYYAVQSWAFKDFVYKVNRGNHVWFITNVQERDERLKRLQ